jgi:3-oxoacyl-ACP reductase-like protein
MTVPTTAPAVPPAAPAPPAAPPAVPPAPAPAPPAAPAAPAGTEPAEDLGFPANTPVAQMDAPAQANYWRHQSKVQQRRYEALGVSAEQVEELRRKATEFDTLTAASQTDQQRAVAEAEARVRAEVAAQYATQLVDVSITAAVAGRMPADQLATALAPVDRRWFLTADGAVDAEKVTAYATQLAGAAAPVRSTPPNHGAGFRTAPPPSGAAAGVEEARRRFGTPQA